MSLSRKIVAALDEQIRSCAAPSAVSAEDGPHQLTMAVGLATPIGISCDTLEFATTAPPPGASAPSDGGAWSIDALKAWGDRLAARVTYLMEPLVLYEAAPQDSLAIYRSKAPTVRNGSRSYYEARLERGGSLRLVRVHFDEATRRRELAPCQFTREVLERLTDDLVASSEG